MAQAAQTIWDWGPVKVCVWGGDGARRTGGQAPGLGGGQGQGAGFEPLFFFLGRFVCLVRGLSGHRAFTLVRPLVPPCLFKAGTPRASLTLHLHLHGPRLLAAGHHFLEVVENT